MDKMATVYNHYSGIIFKSMYNLVSNSIS